MVITLTHAQGPGLGNLTYDSNELFKPISLIQSPHGHGNAAMVNGYLMTIYSSDGGGTSSDGGIEFWDVSDPRNPVRVKQYDNTNTHGLREPHGFGFSRVGNQEYLVAQGIDGIQFWNVTDPLNISLAKYMNLPGISIGDYSGDWWTFWQAPYVYVAGVGQGLYVVDASDPANPILKNQLPTSELGGISPGIVNVVGNLLILMQNEGAKFVTMDVKDPENPVLIQSFDGKGGYSHIFAGGFILTSGIDRNMYVHSVTPSGQISFLGGTGSTLGKGGYGSYQDGFFHSGFSDGYAKFDVASRSLIGTGSSNIAGSDEDFGLVLGNIAFVGSDHSGGSALIVHQTAPDTNGPDVHWVHPANNAVNQALTSRVGVSMSDNIDLDSVNSTTFIVRPKGGSALPGRYSSQMGLVNFHPNAPLAQDTVYEVIVQGMKDFAGNTGGTFNSVFATGNEVTSPPLPTCTIGPFSTKNINTSIPYDVATISGTGPFTYSWKFGDGSPNSSPSNNAPINHTFTTQGSFTIILTVTDQFGQNSCSSPQTIQTPPTPTPPVSASSIIHDGQMAFIANPDNDTVTAINESTLNKAWEAHVGKQPQTLTLSPQGNLWVANQEDASLTVLNRSNGQSLNTIGLPRASRPYGIIFSPDKLFAYVTLEGTGKLL